MGIAAADFYPQINLNPQYTNTGELIKNYHKQNHLTTHSDFAGQIFVRMSYFILCPLI